MQKTIAEINLKAVVGNAESFSKYTGKKICAVVKANAYGHGAEEVTAALSGKADFFAVSILEEGLAVSTAACGKEILVFTPPATLAQAVAMAQGGLSITVADEVSAGLAVEAGRRTGLRVKAHIKVNGGMNRYGCYGEALDGVCRILKEAELACGLGNLDGDGRLGGVWVRGAYSHISSGTRKGAEEQLAFFLQELKRVRAYFPNLTAHLGGTYAAMLGGEFCLDCVRIGLGLYGYYPNSELTDEERARLPKLERVMRVYAQAVSGCEYRFGGVGYGLAEGIEVGQKLSVVRFGYADGFLRRKDNGVVGCEENAGNLCMDACIRKGELCRGEWTPIMTDADEVARRTGTIAYEVLCAATRRAEFRYLYK